MGTLAEKLARDSCIQATLLELELTIKNVKEKKKLEKPSASIPKMSLFLSYLAHLSNNRV